ncbi:hypothetical protein [Streptomyces sp. NPDC048419]|uniref:hypothetical protein n=1 Tax=Streptomyces sp. NPDC048419 TaxID=3365547 RepID=UPI00371BF77F
MSDPESKAASRVSEPSRFSETDQISEAVQTRISEIVLDFVEAHPLPPLAALQTVVNSLTGPPPPTDTTHPGSVTIPPPEQVAPLEVLCDICGQAFTAEQFENSQVKRCPRGGEHFHDTGECLPGGRCGMCSLDLSSPEYIVTSPEMETKESKALEVWNEKVLSTGWHSEAAIRQAGQLCYAAATAIVATSLGSPTNQFERAHAYAMSDAVEGDEDWAMGGGGYREAYEAACSSMGGTPSVGAVLSWMDAIKEDDAENFWINRGYLRMLAQSGSPCFFGTAVTAEGAGRPTFQQIITAIDAGSLIMAAEGGNMGHWRVIIGYQTSTRGGQRVLVCDPKQDGEKEYLYAAFTMEVTYICSSQ